MQRTCLTRPVQVRIGVYAIASVNTLFHVPLNFKDGDDVKKKKFPEVFFSNHHLVSLTLDYDFDEK